MDVVKVFRGMVVLFSFALGIPAFAAPLSVPTSLINKLSLGQTVEVLVEYDDSAIEQVAVEMRKKSFRHIDDDKILSYKTTQYRALKQQVDQAVPSKDIQDLVSYSHLPMSFKRFSSVSALNTFLSQPGIKSVYENTKMHRVLAQSLPLINQPAVASVGEQGANTTVAVIDDGIDFTNTAFGSCTAPGVPSGCRVVVSNNIVLSPGIDHTHGTNVSAIVLGVAPSTKVAMLNVFDGTGSASAADIVSAINWSISNKAAYNIVAINMSLGGSTKFTSPCSTDWSSGPINLAKNAGITVVAASGNAVFTDGLSSPACAPGTISVGAVYDSNIGGVTWGTSPNCTDSFTAADKVTCFSNSASFLTLLAPGAYITAAGITEAGTSQAAPHVAGAVAVLRSTFPSETLAQTQARLTNNGVMITDARNNIVTPRLNLLAAARPVNDDFVNRLTLSGKAGGTSGFSLLATKELSEPNHAGNTGGSSIWWKWVAPSTGQLSVNVTGSNFDTLLGLYSGLSLGALSPLASSATVGPSNGLLLEVVAGKEYELAVDGVAAASGSFSLNWSLNTSPVANLSVSISGPSSVVSGSTVNYVLNINNAGPQSATNVVGTFTVPAGASFLSASSNCTFVANVVTCLAGTIVNGATQTSTIQLIWSDISALGTLSAKVSSDVPDTSGANNTATNIVSIVQLLNNADAPSLPEWGALLLASLLMMTNIRVRRFKK